MIFITEKRLTVRIENESFIDQWQPASVRVYVYCAERSGRFAQQENYRFLRDDIRSGHDLIFIARKTISGRKAGEVGKSMINALSRAKLYKKQEAKR